MIHDFKRRVTYLRGVIDSIVQQEDIDVVCQRVSELLDESIAVDDVIE